MRQEYIVKEIENGWTFRKWARYYLPTLSYPALCTLARNKKIKVDGKVVKMNDILIVGKKLTIHQIMANTSETHLQQSKNIEDLLYLERHKINHNNINCSNFGQSLHQNKLMLTKTMNLAPITDMIIYENDDFAIINKSINICTQGSHDSIAAITNAFIVHRLDKSTSGLLILAKTKHSADAISSQIREHKFKKTYHAILLKPKEPIAQFGTWSQQIDDLNAITEYEIIKQDERYMLAKLMPLTGRKHQLRIHSAENAAPILGDTRYTSSKDVVAPRIYLHCSKIEFTTDRPYKFQCPPAADWNDVLKSRSCIE